MLSISDFIVELSKFIRSILSSDHRSRGEKISLLSLTLEIQLDLYGLKIVLWILRNNTKPHFYLKLNHSSLTQSLTSCHPLSPAWIARIKCFITFVVLSSIHNLNHWLYSFLLHKGLITKDLFAAELNRFFRYPLPHLCWSFSLLKTPEKSFFWQAFSNVWFF